MSSCFCPSAFQMCRACCVSSAWNICRTFTLIFVAPLTRGGQLLPIFTGLVAIVEVQIHTNTSGSNIIKYLSTLYYSLLHHVNLHVSSMMMLIL